MRVILTRASVCMGDDGDAPHEVVWEYDAEVPGQVAIERAAARYCVYMPNASWIAYLNDARTNRNRRPIAVISTDWPAPRFLPGFDPSLPLTAHDGAAELDFDYNCREEPEALWQRMTRAAA